MIKKNSMEDQLLIVDWIIGFLPILTFVAWVYSDAKKRGHNYPFRWALSILLLFVIFLPLWFIKRPRLPHEPPKSTAFELSKGLIIVWTVLCGSWLISYLLYISLIPVASEFEEIGIAIGTIFGIGFI
ncbi:MAG TPA: hypothetical protein EYP60_01930, partial [bacterium (Candidatus Stahlbacteria)]|nr:hypothetical protein [Candidatus Stahlbacteria bacterium]